MGNFDLSLLNLKGLSKPLTKLIESVTKGIGELYRPLGTVAQAYADAKSMIIREEASGVKSELEWRASARINFLELRRQSNIDSIMQRAISALPGEVSAQPVDEDWVASFFDSCKDIGNEGMQQIWGKILAGEVENPGRFSRRTLSMLKNMTQAEAAMFTRMCAYAMEIEDGTYILPIPPHDVYEYMRENGLSTDDECHLKNIGLISVEKIYYIFDEDPSPIDVKYFGKMYQFCMPKEVEDDIDYDVSFFPLTQIGNELLPIAGGKPNPKFISLFCKTPSCINGVFIKKARGRQKARS